MMAIDHSPNRKSKHHNGNLRHNSGPNEEEMVPGMLISPTGSCSTNSSSEENNGRWSQNLYSSSLRMQEKFASALSAKRRTSREEKQKSNLHNEHQHQRNNHYQASQISRSQKEVQNVTNSSILMGAEIIKRQLSQDSPVGAARFDHRGSSIARRRGGDDWVRDSGGGTRLDRDDWDPWRTDSNDETCNDHSNGTGNERGVKNDDYDDTLRVLQQAHFIIDKYNKPRSEEPSRALPSPATKKSETQNEDATRTTPRSYNCLVQRVSEMDDSTFASSSIGQGYLPKSLMRNLTCGQLNTTSDATTKVEIKNEREDFANCNLDFLANLHVEEKNLNSIMKKFTEKQQLLPDESQCINYNPEASKKGLPTGNPSRGTPGTSRSQPCRVTAAAIPFEKMISPRTAIHDELMEDPAYRHALKAGTLWQSLCSQHVRFPALWWDGQEPIGPPLGSTKKRKKPWSYLGRHRVQGDYKLNSLIGNRGSSGRILLHLVVRDVVSGEPIEDIACGCYHPNARGIRTTPDFNPRIEDCRDVWIAHRRRVLTRSLLDADFDDNSLCDSDNDEYSWTTIESLLRHQNKGKVDASPLGAQGGKSCVTNTNLKAVFGSKPPVYTVFVPEGELFELFQNRLDGSIPASVALLRYYLRYRIG